MTTADLFTAVDVSGLSTSVGTLLVAFITVTSQTLKAAHANPVDSLKYE